ncbi:hypothetical protein HOK51_02105 [Candidatus Woesearchaeota archaeon]|jgi:glutathione synthase/RimK-type ligase-like ATP-grasp enzyme|nr:hypothetical protein [Candidatus Woesearchaeota archaeon]MBT6518609.1 hypothetical protein [Candidatus Woesearchaeota archaeon]MBT7368751.1 hypothetical protein [Candidatus Woesearchaeota archaeon]
MLVVNKMTRAAILIGSLESFQKEEFADPMKESFAKIGLDSIIVPLNKIEELNKVDIVYTLPHSIQVDLSFLDEKNIPIINSHRSHSLSKNKMESSDVFIKNNIPTPDTITTDSQDELINFINKHNKIILKQPDICAGYGHMIVEKINNNYFAWNNDSKGEFDFSNPNFVKANKRVFAQPYYAQDFISDFNPDNIVSVYRAYVIGNNVPMATARVGKDQPIVNVARGAHYEFVTPDKKMKEIALKTADSIGFEVGVVDLLKDKNQNYFVIECDCDGLTLVVCRKFRKLKEFEDKYDFDQHIGRRLIEIVNGESYRT